jgi:hypothetical protein
LLVVLVEALLWETRAHNNQEVLELLVKVTMAAQEQLVRTVTVVVAVPVKLVVTLCLEELLVKVGMDYLTHFLELQ